MINWKYVPIFILKFVFATIMLVGLMIGLRAIIELVYYVFSFVGR